VAQQSASNPYYEFLQARRLEGEGEIDRAVAALQRAAAADPNSAEIKAELGAMLMRRTPPARADGEKLLKEALAIDADNVEANRTLGYLYANSLDARNRTVTPKVTEDIRTAISHLE
jgi:cytochrome c-type biogenesis protein CcmH/NrfG